MVRFALWMVVASSRGCAALVFYSDMTFAAFLQVTQLVRIEHMHLNAGPTGHCSRCMC